MNLLGFLLGLLCRVLDVYACGFHARRSRASSRRAQQVPRLEVEICDAHQRTRQTYGVQRLQRALPANRECEIELHRHYDRQGYWAN